MSPAKKLLHHFIKQKTKQKKSSLANFLINSIFREKFQILFAKITQTDQHQHQQSKLRIIIAHLLIIINQKLPTKQLRNCIQSGGCVVYLSQQRITLIITFKSS